MTMSSESKKEINPLQEAPDSPSWRRKMAVMGANAASHLRKSKNTHSDDVSMYHVIAACEGEHVAQDIARRMHWDVTGAIPTGRVLTEAPESGKGFSQSDFEAALRKVSRKIGPKQ
jgi:hypothetical protein